MDGQTLNVWKIWLGASLAASALLLVVPLLFQAVHPWPFVLLNWLIFAPGFLVALRRAPLYPKRDFRIAVLAFAAAGLLVYSLSPNWP